MYGVKLVAEQLRIDGGVDYMVYYKNGATFRFEQRPTEQDLKLPYERGKRV